MIPRHLRYDELPVRVCAYSHDPQLLFFALERKIDDVPFVTQYCLHRDSLNMTQKQFKEFSQFMSGICKELSMELAYFIQKKLEL